MKLSLVLLTMTNIKNIISNWWALLIVVPCFVDFFTSNRKFFDAIGFLVGLGILLACLGF